MIVFQVSLSFDSVKEILKLRFQYSEGITSDNENFRSTIFQPFQFKPEQKKTCGNKSQEEETKHIHVQLRSSSRWRCSLKKVFLSLQLY